MHRGNNRKLQNGCINMGTEGTVDVSGKAYTGICDIVGHQLAWKYLGSGIDATDCQDVFQGPSISTTPQFLC